MLSCCGKVFPYSFLFCRIYNVKVEEERGFRGREKKIEEDRRREITIAPQKLCELLGCSLSTNIFNNMFT